MLQILNKEEQFVALERTAEELDKALISVSNNA